MDEYKLISLIKRKTGKQYKSISCIDWNVISRKPLSENFIREFQNKIDWCYITAYQKLSEDFIREFRYLVYWSEILKSQTLSENFKEEFKYKLYIY